MGVAERHGQPALRAVFLLLVILGAVWLPGLAAPSTSVAASGIAITGSFYRQPFEIPQGGSAVGPSIYVVVSNQGTDEFNVRMLTAAVRSDNVSESGISINLSRVSFSLQRDAQQKIQIGVDVAESVPAGQYEVSVTAESYRDTGEGISVSGSATQTTSLTVTGESANVSVNTVGPSGQPVVAQVRLFRMVGGSGYEVTYSDSGSLKAKVVPGSFSAEAYSPGTGVQLCDPATFDVTAGEDKTVTLIARTVYFEDDFVVIANYDSETKKLLNARTMTTLTNVLETMANTEVRLVVTFNGDPLEEITVLGPLSLPVGQTGAPWNYIPADGWKGGLYGFKYQLYVEGQPIAETAEQTLNAGGGAGVASWLWVIFVILGILGAAGLGFLTFFLLKRRKKEEEKPRKEKKRKEEKPEPMRPPAPVRKPEPVLPLEPVRPPEPVRAVQPPPIEEPPVVELEPLASISSLKARMAAMGRDQGIGKDTEEDTVAERQDNPIEAVSQAGISGPTPSPPEAETEHLVVESTDEEIQKPATHKPGIFSKVTATGKKGPPRPISAREPPPVKPEDEIIINWPSKPVEPPKPPSGLEQVTRQRMEAQRSASVPEGVAPVEEAATEEPETDAHAGPPILPTRSSFAEAARLRMEARQRASAASEPDSATEGSPAEGDNAGESSEGEETPPST